MEKKAKIEKNPIVQDDILRYKKNKFAANFALLALVFNVLYFALLYTVHASQIYTYLVGGSVILNLLVLLMGFFASEGIKGYNKKFCILLFILAALQIARIFIFPTMGMSKGWLRSNYYFGIKMTAAGNGTMVILFLAASAACFIVSGVFGFIMTQRLESFSKKVENGEISIEKTLTELDEADKQKETVSAVADHNSASTEETNSASETEIKTVSSGEEDNG